MRPPAQDVTGGKELASRSPASHRRPPRPTSRRPSTWRASLALRGIRPSLAELRAVAAEPDRVAARVDRDLESAEPGATVRDLHNELLRVHRELEHPRSMRSSPGPPGAALAAVTALTLACGVDTDRTCAPSYCATTLRRASDRSEIRRCSFPIRFSAGQGSSMPPAGGPSAELRRMLVEWLGRGRPRPHVDGPALPPARTVAFWS